MDYCFSSYFPAATASASTSDQPPTIELINADGSLIEYYQSIEVFLVLGLNHRAFFLCTANELFYSHHIQALEDNHLIELGKLYFFLPAKRLNHPLTAAEMAALAVCANSALADAGSMKKKKRGSGRRKGVQVMPFVTAMESDGYEVINESAVGSWKTYNSGKKRDQVKQRPSSNGEGAIKRPFRPRLSSIEEVFE